MRWLPNPYAIAQKLANSPDITAFLRSGKAADGFLLDTLVSSRKQRTMTGTLIVLRQIAALFERPVTLQQALEKTKDVWAREGYTVEEMARVLPVLIPIVDAVVSETFADSDDLIVDNVSFLDPVQGSVGDCYLISSMIAAAWTKRTHVKTRLDASGFDPPSKRSFEWEFHDDTGAVDGQIQVSGRVMMDGALPRYARSSSQTEDWPSLIEKAYVAKVCALNMAQGEPIRVNYQSIDAKNEGSMPQRACQTLFGGEVQGEILDSVAGRKIFVAEGRLETASGVMSKPVMAWTKKEEDMEETDPDVWKATGIWPRHAYAVLGVMISNNRLKHVVLRNPHGADTDPDRVGYHPGPWDPDGRPPVTLNKDGVFAISRKLFYDNFEDIGWLDH